MPGSIKHKAINFADYQQLNIDFAMLSLRDLLEARDLYHVHLMRYPEVVATAVGRYRIRKEDSWPRDAKQKHGTGVRDLANSEVRYYSWPCILVFVSEWQDPDKFKDHPEDMVPKTLFMPDGRRVPVCVVEAPKDSVTDVEARDLRTPLNNIGPGHALLVATQGREYGATLGCLVSDGHKVYALTNRHVTGERDEIVYAMISGHRERIGVSAARQLTKLPFHTLYPDYPGRDTFVNVDVGLVEIDDLNRWTTKIRDIGMMGPMADFSSANISLSLVGCQVRGIGAASGDMLGEIQALFYRYKVSSGFEYVADLLIGPRSSAATGKEEPPAFATHPGDSGALWLLEPTMRAEGAPPRPIRKKAKIDSTQLLPLAVQWGRNMLHSAGPAPAQSYVLATLLSRVCALMEVDPVRDWNVDQTDTWGSIGHFSIATRAQVALSGRFPKLSQLMANNALIISHDEETILNSDFKGMGSADFVAMADVPDFFWKPRVAKQHHDRASEGPNHFADMDHPDANGQTLLELTKDPSFIDPDKWQTFYDSINEILTGEAITPVHRGLLPFRVWQIFDAMVDFATAGKAEEFVCAAGVLCHYVGDACQPLHISYLHDGDPANPTEHTFSRGKKAGDSEKRPLGAGVHSAYEDAMVNAHRAEILDGLKATAVVAAGESVASGFEAAARTIDMMRNTFNLLPPKDMIQTYLDAGGGIGKATVAALWDAYGQSTIQTMQSGSHLLAVLWESAWALGDGESNVASTDALSEGRAMEIVTPPDFLPSMTVDKIGAVLKGRPGA